MPNDQAILLLLEAIDKYVEAKVKRLFDAEAEGHSDGSYHRAEKEAKQALYQEARDFLNTLEMHR